MLSAIDRVLAPVTWLVAAFAVAVLLIGPQVIGAEKPPPTKQAVAATAASGKDVFTSSCGGCHTLADAETNGQTGPNLDELKPDAERVKQAIAQGPGIMPENLYEGAEADQVAQYVAESAGG